jgi:hypothetical protein
MDYKALEAYGENNTVKVHLNCMDDLHEIDKKAYGFNRGMSISLNIATIYVGL